LKGDTGSPGATGPQGPQGPVGATGPAGADGASTWEAISGKPTTFTPSAHTHTVSAITDFPTIPAAQVNSDWNATSGLAQILNKPDLANLPGQPVNGDSSPFFADLYTGNGVYFNSDGTEGQGVLLKSLQLPSCSIGAMGNANRANGIIRDGQNLFFGDADGSFWNKLAFASLDNSFSVGQTIAAPENTSALTASYSVTGANTTPLLNLSGTWNTTGAARGILLNITDTASNAASLLADLRVGSRTQYAFTKSRQLWLFNSSPATQDASNFERGFMRWNSNVLEIGTEAGGTGTARNLQFITSGAATPIVFSGTAGSSLNITGVRSLVTTGGMSFGNGSVISGWTASNYATGSSDPTTGSLTTGNWQVHRNTTSGTIRLWANNAGTLVSVALA
jgi:hypothetical protein